MKRRLRVYSRHPSHNQLREATLFLPVLTMLRLGSTTVSGLNYRLELNSVQGVKNSANKLLMKQCFDKAGVRTAPWWTNNGAGVCFISNDTGNKTVNDGLTFPIIVKHIYGSRGTGNSQINTKDELAKWMEGKDMSKYIIESYKTFNREYRIHATAMGAFYACRKMLLKDTPQEKRFQRHDDNCVWYKEDNKDFDKPSNWDAIVADCVKALAALGLDIGAFDVKVQSAKDKNGVVRPEPDYIIIESCSAPSFGKVTTEKYIEIIPKLVNYKLNGVGKV